MNRGHLDPALGTAQQPLEPYPDEDLNHQIDCIHQESVEVNPIWARRLVACDEWRSFKGQINGPGTDVFDSQGHTGERAKMVRGRGAFNTVLTAARGDLPRMDEGVQRGAILAGITAAIQAKETRKFRRATSAGG